MLRLITAAAMALAGVIAATSAEAFHLVSRLSRPRPSTASESGDSMIGSTRIRVLRLALILTIVFNLLALLVLLHTTPVIFTAFMFIGQPLLVVTLILLIGAVLADLKAKELF